MTYYRKVSDADVERLVNKFIGIEYNIRRRKMKQRTFVECLRYNIKHNWSEGGLFESMVKDDCVKACNKIEQLEAKNEKLKRTMRLHAGDCCSLNNEVDLFHNHWEDAENRVKELERKNKILSERLKHYEP